MVNGYSIVTYQRPLRASDKLDLPIIINGSQAIVWAIGPLNQRSEVSFHSKYTRGDRFIDFGRQPIWNCPVPDGEMKMIGGNKEPQPEIYDQNSNHRNNNNNNRHQQDDEPLTHEIGRPNRRPTQEVNRRGSQQSHITNRNDEQNNRGNSNRRTVPPPRTTAKEGAWEIPPIQCYEPEDGVFYAQMGPTGGKQGYPAITGI